MDLQLFNEGDLELVINLSTGESFATQAGYSRMGKVSAPAISKRVSTLDPLTSGIIKEVKILTGKGIKTVNLITGKLVRKWLIADNPELAEEMIEVGWTVYCHQKAGFKIKSSLSEEIKPKTALELAKDNLGLVQQQIQLLEDLERKEALLQEKQLLLDTQQPKVDFYNQFRDAVTNITVNDFAKIISNKGKIPTIGDTTMFRILRNHDFLMFSSSEKDVWNQPFNRFIKSGVFVVIQKKYDTEQKLYNQTLITPKGQQYLFNWLITSYDPSSDNWGKIALKPEKYKDKEKTAQIS